MVLDILCMCVLYVSGNDFHQHLCACKDGLCKSFSNIIKVDQLFDLIT